jgi:hypothetical protein
MTKVMGTEAFFEACQRIARNENCDPYAKAYAKAGIAMCRNYTMEAIKVQSLYLLSNLTYWRGEEAKKVKNVLRHFAGIGEARKKAKRSRQSY